MQPACYCMRSRCDVAFWPSATVAQLKLESFGGTSAVHIDSCPTHRLGILQISEYWSLHITSTCLQGETLFCLRVTSNRSSTGKYDFFSSASLHHVLLRRESSFVPVTLLSKFWFSYPECHCLLPAPHASRLSLSTEETPGPPGEGLMFSCSCF